jgi:3-hexulose-6-phosphate synthase
MLTPPFIWRNLLLQSYKLNIVNQHGGIMELQLALDLVSFDEAVAIINETKEFIDIIEIGTPLIIKEGISIVKKIHDLFPDLKILADVKIADGGKAEAIYAFDAGADIVTVLAAAENETIKNVVEVAMSRGKKTMADMIAVSDIIGRAAQIDQLGVDYLCVHTAFDIQYTNKNPLVELLLLQSVVSKSKTAVAGGVNLKTVAETIHAMPEIIVVGGAITTAPDKKEAAAEFKRMMTECRDK